MQDFQQRVIDEKDALEEKLIKLTKFINGQVFNTLDITERNLLTEQRTYMSRYLNVLNRRITRFPK